MTDIKLVPLTSDDRERFILDNQEAFNYGAVQEFGMRDNHFEEEGQIISRVFLSRGRFCLLAGFCPRKRIKCLI